VKSDRGPAPAGEYARSLQGHGPSGVKAEDPEGGSFRKDLRVHGERQDGNGHREVLRLLARRKALEGGTPRA